MAGETAGTAITAKGLSKHYGSVTALDGLDLEVERGTVMGLLGPNGAGKTTTVRILATLTRADAGTARVAGWDVGRDHHEVRRRISLTGQFTSVDELLTGRENLQLVARLRGLGRRGAGCVADDLLERFDLTDAADRRAATYSGGMRRRLDLAAGLIGDVEVLFLDEPTTGLDLASRHALWDLVAERAAAGITVVLTTQYLEEADRLADDILVVDHGKVIARGDARSLKRQVGGDNIGVTVADASDVDRVVDLLRTCTDGDPVVDRPLRTVTAPTGAGIAGLARVANVLADAGVAVEDLSLRQPTLDEVFLTLTGQPTDPDQNPNELEEMAS
jgi:ABC-2 type transport system ATP-binding protein